MHSIFPSQLNKLSIYEPPINSSAPKAPYTFLLHIHDIQLLSMMFRYMSFCHSNFYPQLFRFRISLLSKLRKFLYPLIRKWKLILPCLKVYPSGPQIGKSTSAVGMLDQWVSSFFFITTIWNWYLTKKELLIIML